MFYFDNILGNKVLRSDKLANVDAFFTTRNSLIKTKEPDMSEQVLKNKEIFCKYFNIPLENLHSPEQTHSANIQLANSRVQEYPNTDALIITDNNIAIFLNFADCTPVILYDKKQNIGAISHAGWRGTAQRIAPLTVEKMIKEYNSTPSDITAIIGPAISLCCYNVGEEVFEKLKATVNNFENLYKIKDNQTFVDLKGINARQLTEIGVEDIDICPYCTVCNNEEFYSYRKENATTNRHSAVLKLRS